MAETRPAEAGTLNYWRIIRHFPVTLLGVLLLLLVLFGWWQSGRFSERRLHYFGTKSAEVFTSSSLIRVSVVNGYIDPHGRPRGYRQPNARGKVTIRPLAPALRISPSIWELIFGYWHLAALVLVFAVSAAVFEGRAFLRRVRRVSSATEMNQAACPKAATGRN